MAYELIISFGQAAYERVQFAFDRDTLASSAVESEVWLDAVVTAQASSLRGEAKVSIMKGDFARLLSGLRPLYHSLRGAATFDTLEDQVGFTITGDGMGHIVLKGFLRDRAGGDNRLEFTLRFDQTLLAQSIAQIDAFYAVKPNI
jgi:hypothetical protein